MRRTRTRARALAADPNNAVAWHRLGNALSGLKRHKAAIACYDKALALAPEHRTIWKDRGAAIHASKRKTANFDINEEPVPDPQDADAWATRAGFPLAFAQPLLQIPDVESCDWV